MFDEMAGEQRSFKDKIREFFLRPSNPKNLKVLGLTFLILMMMAGGSVLAQGPLFNSPRSSPSIVPDPIKPLWYDCIPASNSWNLRVSTWISNAGCTASALGNILQVTPNSTSPGIALSRSAINIDQGSSKVLEFDMMWAEGNTGNSTDQPSIYLTRNSTLPLNNNYNPYNDINVVYLIKVTQNAGNTAGNIFTYFQTDPAKTVSQTDTGCPHSGSVFNCISSTNFGAIPSNILLQLTEQLNFTGQTINASVSNLQFLSCVANPCGTTLAQSTETQLPQLSLTGNYYLGIWTQPTASPRNIQFYGSYNPPNNNPCCSLNQNSFTFAVYTPNAPATQAPAFIEPGGFFGPIIRSLISIGVFIVQNIIAFLNFLAGLLWPVLTGVFTVLANATKSVLNALGGFFGLGNIGDELISFFTGIVNWLANIVGSAFGQILNLVNLLVQLLTWLASIFGGPIWTGIIGIATLLASGWTTIIAAYGFLTQLSTTGLLGINYYFLVDWIFGMFMLSTKGMEGFKTWIDLNEMVFSKIALAMWFFIKESFTIGLHIKQMLVNWV